MITISSPVTILRMDLLIKTFFQINCYCVISFLLSLEKKTGGSESKFGKKLIGEKKRKFEKKPKLPKKPQITHPTTVGGGNKLPLKWENLLKDGVVTTKLRSELSKLFISELKSIYS